MNRRERGGRLNDLGIISDDLQFTIYNVHRLLFANDNRYHLIARSKEFKGFDRHLMESLKIVDASETGTVDFELLMDERYTNLNGVMHGGAAGVIFDMCTTSALGPLAKPGFWE